MGISVNPQKAYLGYPSIQLLGQKVDSLGLWTAEDKLQAISKLSFPTTLAKLETYLGMTGWLRDYIAHYAAIAKPLQERKTLMLASSPRAGNERKNYATKAELQAPSEREMAAFNALQEALSKPSFLVHFDDKLTLYIDLDASKDFGFGAMVYHVLGNQDVPKNGYPQRSKIRPILFLSRLLKDAETRYWPTELELAGIVWVLSKTRHMIESAPHTVVYTDHGAALGIAKQTSMTTSSTAKLNLRLIRASEYIQRFRSLEFRHKPGKQHVVPDALSRLGQAGSSIKSQEEGQLDTLHGCAYHVTLVEMSDSFKRRLVEEYPKDPQWHKILGVIKSAASEEQQGPCSQGTQESTEQKEERRIGLRFKLKDGLIYYTNFEDGRERLCIPNALKREVFELAHDRQHHGGFHRTYERISRSLYLKNLVKNLKAYIEHCPECELNQTKRHKPYGSLVPIDRPSIPFHTIAMDFIVGLPMTSEGYDSLLTVTDKFSKRVLLVPGKSTFSAAEWADVLLAALTQQGWGIPAATISDRDSKFMSELWQAIFKKLGTDILASTAYHPQTDGQSERTNQTVEIAIRYFVTSSRDSEWTLVLPYLQGSLNNSKNRSTGVSPNEILYGFNVRDTLGLLTELPPEQYSRLRQLKRDQAEDSLAFSNAMAKAYYDQKHQPLDLASGSLAFLRLHDGYSIPGLENHKLHHQRIGPFKVLDKVGMRAYRLELPPIMRIHPVVSIAQLEPASGADSDPYGRVRNANPPPVVGTNDEYLIEAVLGKRISRGKTQYLIKWWSWGHENNVWYYAEDLQDCSELIAEYEARRQQFQRNKTHNQTQENAQTQSQQTQNQTQSRRSQPAKRGRPRKEIATSQALVSTQKTTPAEPPKKRGRPRKIAS